MRPALPMPRRDGFSLLASLAVVSITALSLGTVPAKRPEATAAATRPAGPTDAELHAMVVGRWQTVSNGTRVVENRPDGTASMDVTFDFVASLLYGEKIKLELRWGIKDGVLVHTIQTGEPKSTVDRIVATYGSQASYHFKSIGEKKMHLVRVIDPDEQYVWTRVD